MTAGACSLLIATIMGFAVLASVPGPKHQLGAPDPEKALIYVIRQPDPLVALTDAGSARTAFVYSEEGFFGVVEYKTYTYGYLNPGEQTLFVAYHGKLGTGRFTPENVAKMKQRGQKLTLEAGETYFLRATGFKLQEYPSSQKAQKKLRRFPYVIPDDRERRRAAEALAELQSHQADPP